ncbi:MAG TPA: LysR family transcriptional regulator [Gaiellaceae bacterium]|nr:LysR family transcriptional regulator [Gaiellaceae bacterium]
MERSAGSWHGVELRHLAALEAVAREKSFSAAAESLGYTQSAISGQVTALERIVGVRLFSRLRGSRGVELTEEGRLLLEHAMAITARVQAARADLQAVRNGQTGVLRAGTFQTASHTLLPGIMRTLSRPPDPLRLMLYEDAAIETLAQLVEGGELDVAFVLLPIDSEELATVQILEDPWYLLMRKDHPLARERELNLERLGGVPLISLDRVALSTSLITPRSIRLAEDAILAAGVIPRITLRMNDYRSVRVLVEAGMGCGLIPSLALEDYEGELVAVPIESRLPPRIVGIAWHRHRQLTGSIARFVEAARAEAHRRGDNGSN